MREATRRSIVETIAQESPHAFKDMQVPGEMLDHYDALCYVQAVGHETWVAGRIFRVIGFVREPTSKETRYLLMGDDPRFSGKQGPAIAPVIWAIKWIYC
jgi:hypothetical protein